MIHPQISSKRRPLKYLVSSMMPLSAAQLRPCLANMLVPRANCISGLTNNPHLTHAFPPLPDALTSEIVQFTNFRETQSTNSGTLAIVGRVLAHAC